MRTEIPLKNACEVIEGYRIPYKLETYMKGDRTYLWTKGESGMISMTPNGEPLYALPGYVSATKAEVIEWINGLKRCAPVRIVTRGQFKSPLVQALS